MIKYAMVSGTKGLGFFSFNPLSLFLYLIPTSLRLHTKIFKFSTISSLLKKDKEVKNDRTVYKREKVFFKSSEAIL